MYSSISRTAAARKNQMAILKEEGSGLMAGKKQITFLRFLTKLAPQPNGCWNWLSSITRGGYGLFYANGKHVLSHRYSYQMFAGKIPEGLTLDHLCRRRNCVNPDHLEAVTPRENILRGIGSAAKNHRKTHCPKGHPLEGSNLSPTNLRMGLRLCRICKNERERMRRTEK